ncbi:VapE domain-containing protein [Pseudomonas aeruginosa]|uniref:VapE domain-containing protein n=1 Tax=Pseudomonas aeruginosa TaxID=287 RepID=UPI003D27018A
MTQKHFRCYAAKWISELGELDAFNKADSTKAKQFFSASVDTFREKYGRRSRDVPRQCVFVGTTNQEEYLKDTTGNRRYWPVLLHEGGSGPAARDPGPAMGRSAVLLPRRRSSGGSRVKSARCSRRSRTSATPSTPWEHKLIGWLEGYVGETVTSADLLGTRSTSTSGIGANRADASWPYHAPAGLAAQTPARIR